jgi:hypothetical protein
VTEYLTRAERLEAELKVSTLTGAARALAEEAVLTVVRLEQLDRVLQGNADAWLDIVTRMPPTVAEVVISAPLAEVRQQAMALKGLLSELGKLTGQEVAAPVVSKADEVKAKRDARIAEARRVSEQHG